jgi:hypothetical protein
MEHDCGHGGLVAVRPAVRQQLRRSDTVEVNCRWATAARAHRELARPLGAGRDAMRQAGHGEGDGGDAVTGSEGEDTVRWC